MDDMEKTMIRLIAVAFALAVAASALATPLAPLHQPDGMITQVRPPTVRMPTAHLAAFRRAQVRMH